jgi:hypothetical protein
MVTALTATAIILGLGLILYLVRIRQRAQPIFAKLVEWL